MRPKYWSLFWQLTLRSQNHGFQRTQLKEGMLERLNIDTLTMREVRERGEGAFPGKGNARDEELAEWKRRALRAEQERDILKKTVLIFAPNMK